MSDLDSASTPNNEPKDRHEPRGRKPNDQLPPSRAREVQRAFRLRRAEHLAALEERINLLENENASLRALLALPEADRGRIGSGPTGKGKSLKEGGVPMSERVRARKEARERERRIKAGLPVEEISEQSDRARDSETLSPGVNHGALHHAPQQQSSSSASLAHQPQQHQRQQQDQLSLFTNPADNSQFNYQLPMPFNLPVSPDTSFDFSSSLDSMLKPGATPNFGSMFNMFGGSDDQGQNNGSNRRSSMSPPPPPAMNNNAGSSSSASIHQQHHQPQQPTNNSQPDLLTRLKSCCHLSDSHVVNDPGLLIFATRLCQSFPCQFGGMHVEVGAGISDAEHLMLEDSWRALKNQLDPGGEADGENRINTGRMAAELVVRAAHSRGASGWILCRYREGMSIKTSMIRDLVQGLGGKLE